jgi:hypothetical protein
MSDEQKDGNASYGLLVSFSGLYPTQVEEHAFVHGHETGEIWADLKRGVAAERTVHAENQTVLERMAVALGYAVEFAPTSPPVDGWLIAHFKPLPRKGHLAVVK